jgi:hypothetical protein
MHIVFSPLFNTDGREQSNQLSVRKPLKRKQVTTRIAPHAQQNDETRAMATEPTFFQARDERSHQGLAALTRMEGVAVWGI